MYRTPDRRASARSTIGKYVYDKIRRHGPKALGAAMAASSRTARNLFNRGLEGAESMVIDAGNRATTAIRNTAERVANSMAGGRAMNNGANVVVPAQLIPGRGAELAYQQLNVLQSIKFKMGENPGPQLTDAFGREKMLYKGQSIMHAFAFKMQLTPPSYVNDDDNIPVNRFYVHNCFRHVLAGANNTVTDQAPYGRRTQSWNQTLGPDKSLVRQAGGVVAGASQTGSAYAVPAAGLALNNTLASPFRYPTNGEFMFSRMTRQLIENLGWNANPMKMMQIADGPGTLSPTPLYVYGNANPNYSTGIVSMPANLPNNAEPAADTGPSYYYRTQCGRGQVSYNFNNDGTNPVVIDIVITRIKKGNTVLRGDLYHLEQAYKQGYLNYAYANDGQADFRGQPPVAADVLTNARCQFLPAKALSSFKKTTDATGVSDQYSSQPFKQVARDQFIIAGGASRNWSTYLQALDYDARHFSQASVSDPTTGSVIANYDASANCLDEFSYVFSIAASGVPAPYIEYAGSSGAAAAVIDRRGTDCSVSVTGSYKEVPHPVYLTKAIKETYINGRLDTAGFAATATGLSITTNDIASIGQATRGTTNTSALIGMGALNTVGGG